MHADTSLPVHAQVQVASYVIRGCVPQLDVTFAVMFIFGHGFTTTLGPPSTLEAVCNGRKSESYNTRAVQRDTQRWPLVGSICKKQTCRNAARTTEQGCPTRAVQWDTHRWPWWGVWAAQARWNRRGHTTHKVTHQSRAEGHPEMALVGDCCKNRWEAHCATGMLQQRVAEVHLNHDGRIE